MSSLLFTILSYKVQRGQAIIKKSTFYCTMFHYQCLLSSMIYFPIQLVTLLFWFEVNWTKMIILHLMYFGSLLHFVASEPFPIKQIYPQHLQVTVSVDFSHFSGIYSQRLQDYRGFPFYEKIENKMDSGSLK